MADLPGLDRPFVGAPMAGGPSTPELAAAVCEAGGLGQLAGAYLGVEDLRARIGRTRELTSRPFGVNLFVPTDTTDAAGPEVERYAAALRPEAERHGLTLPEPDWHDTDHWQDKLALLFAERVAVVSFHFGCPPPQVVQQLHEVGARVVISATSAGRGGRGGGRRRRRGVPAGRDGRGPPGHARGRGAPQRPGRAGTPRGHAPGRRGPAGGRRWAGHQGAGAGRARRRRDRGAGRDGPAAHPRGGHRPVHREALVAPGSSGTVVTRAFTGRPARVLRNRFTDRYGDLAPAAFPVVGQLTARLRARAAADGDPQGMALYAGTGHREARDEPAGEVVRDLSG